MDRDSLVFPLQKVCNPSQTNPYGVDGWRLDVAAHLSDLIVQDIFKSRDSQLTM